MTIKYLPAEELREGGYLQEANRIFFHPLGLALEVKSFDKEELISRIRKFLDEIPDGVDDISAALYLLAEFADIRPDEFFLSGVWDYRDDPEGMIFDPSTIDDDFIAKAVKVRKEYDAKCLTRRALLHYTTQPVPEADGPQEG